jgi:hypothetical protein
LVPNAVTIQLCEASIVNYLISISYVITQFHWKQYELWLINVFEELVQLIWIGSFLIYTSDCIVSNLWYLLWLCCHNIDVDTYEYRVDIVSPSNVSTLSLWETLDTSVDFLQTIHWHHIRHCFWHQTFWQFVPMLFFRILIMVDT